MEDIDKTRLEYVARLEEQVQHLQRELAIYKPLAQKWQPIATAKMTQQGAAITLQFGGKQTTGTISTDTLLTTDLTTMTSSVIDTLCESLMIDRLRDIVGPEVDRMMKGVAAQRGASTSW
jgi:hypothetical protein